MTENSSSVTGSDLTDAELELLSITRIQGKVRVWLAALRKVQREAIAPYAEALRELHGRHGCYPVDRECAICKNTRALLGDKTDE